MGFFSEIVSETRRSQLQQPARQAATAPGIEPARPTAAPEPKPAQPTPEPPPASPMPARESPVPAAPAAPTPEPAQAASEPPAIDLTPAPQAPDNDAVRRKHAAAEAKRKAEFDARQADKKAARQAALHRIGKSDAATLLSASVKRVAADTERLTRRNMKEAVAEQVQARCREDANFAMLVMDPMKSMANCFRYINRKAREYAEQEMKDEGIERAGTYGLDIPDGIVYQWAEEYFKDENAKEDHEDDERFIPRPYVPTSSGRKAAKATAAKKPAPAEKPKAQKPQDGGMDQISLM